MPPSEPGRSGLPTITDDFSVSSGGSCGRHEHEPSYYGQHDTSSLNEQQGALRRLPGLVLSMKSRQRECSSPPVSPRSACSTPGRADGCLRQGGAQHWANRPLRGIDRHRLSQDCQRSLSASANPWSVNGQASGSTYSSSSACSIVRAIAGLGLEGPGGAAAARAAAGGRGSISKAKQILAEAIGSVPGAHGLASCGSSAADTGVLSPLLSIIRNNGVVKPTAVEHTKSVSRRSSFNEAGSGWSRSSLYSSSSSDCSMPRCRVSRQASFSEAAGGLNSPDPGVDGSGRASSINSPLQQQLSPALAPLSSAQQQQKVVDCLETVRYLAMDESNRMALIDLGAVELLMSKLQAPSSSKLVPSSSNSIGGGGAATGAAPAVVEAALSALSVLAKHDFTKLRVWDNPQSAALLQLLAQRHTSPVVKAAFMCVAALAWSVDPDRSLMASSGSSVFDSVSSHPGRDDTASIASSSCGSNVLLTPALIPAIAAGLHPAADPPVLLSLLKLLNKAASSSCLAPSPASSPCSSSQNSDSSNEQLCAVQGASTAAWRTGWQQAIFALPPLLCCAAPVQPSCGRQQQVVGAVLEVLVTVTEQHPDFHGAICAAGCLPALLDVLMSSGASSHHGLQAACTLQALLDCPDAVQELRKEQSLLLLLRVLGDRLNSVDVRLAVLHMLRRLAAASHACVELLKLHGAVHTVVALLQELHSSEVKRASIALLQLLGKQVVVKPRKRHSLGDSSSQRSSFESTCSASSSGHQHLQCHHAGARDAAHQLGQLAPRHQGAECTQHRLAQQRGMQLHAAAAASAAVQ